MFCMGVCVRRPASSQRKLPFVRAAGAPRAAEMSFARIFLFASGLS
jgi:hypothetical protein